MYTDANQINRYETWELDTLLAQIERPRPWLLDRYFHRERYFETSVIEFDLIDRGRRLAPFVSPLVAGKPMRREGSRTKQLKPAYIKPAALVTPPESFTRRPGEPYGGRMSNQQRFDAIVAEYLDSFDQMIDNRLEWMAANALVSGGITISGEDYPTTYVDFGRDAALSITLSGTARWSQTTSTPLDDIESASLLVRRKSKGAVVDDIVVSGDTWAVMRKNQALVDMIDIRYRRNYGTDPTGIDAGPRNNLNVGQLVGVLNGRFHIWVYDAYYQDDTGADQPYLPSGTALLIAGSAIEGAQYYGAINDLDAGLQAVKMFTKSDKKFNPSALELVAQSAPLVAPKRINAMAKLSVL